MPRDNEYTPPKRHLRVGRYAFWSALIGAVVILITAPGLLFVPNRLALRVLSWLTLGGVAMMLGGLVVYLGFVGFTFVQRRNANTEREG